MDDWRKVFIYNDYEMRSYSETRVAAVLDALEVAWLYEPHKIQTRHGRYKPDFFLPTVKAYIEVKGPRPTQEEIEKGQDVESRTGYPVFFSHGRPKLVFGELTGGFIEYFRTNKKWKLTTLEIGEKIKSELDDETYWRYLLAGRHLAKPPYREVNDAMISYITSLMTRDHLETYLESQHEPLNSAKEDNEAAPSTVEQTMLLVSNWLKGA